MEEYKNKNLQDLNKLISEKTEAIRNFRFGSTGSKIKNVKLGKTLHKEVARIMTEISLRKNKKKDTK